MSAQETTAPVESPNVTVIPADEPLHAKAEEPKPAEGETKSEVVEAKDEENEPGDEGQERDDKGRFKNRVQERIDELTRKAGEATREAAYWRGMHEQATKPADAPAQAAAAPGKPQEADYATNAEYVEALTDWKIDQRDKSNHARQQAETQASNWSQRAAAAREAMPDFDAVLGSSTAPMTAAMADALRESEHGPALAYHLAKNPADAIRIAGLSPTSAARELGKLEATLSTPKAAEAAPKRMTSAPTPPTPIGSNRSTTGDPGKMSQADYIAWRATQLKEQR